MMEEERHNVDSTSCDAPGHKRHTEAHKSFADARTVREKLAVIIESRKFHITVICLVIFDVVLVLGELILDLEISEDENSVVNVLPEILHYMSIAILSLFVVEVGVKLFVMRTEFFRHKLEMFDALVILVAFALDVAFVFQDEKARQAISLLVILRLWRITRIINGIILSVKAEASRTVEKEKETRETAEKNFFELRKFCLSQDTYIEKLESLLSGSGVWSSVTLDQERLKCERPEHLFQIAEGVDSVSIAADCAESANNVQADGKQNCQGKYERLQD